MRGKVSPLYYRSRPIWDHPRPCGEKTRSLLYYGRIRGSPPPMRGKDRRGRKTRLRTWITPAHAGKSKYRSSKSGGVPDHPRPCGEKCTAHHLAHKVYGSPPPMRGKVLHISACIVLRWITPAHAGKSIVIPRHIGFVWDHPRPCGEKQAFSFLKVRDFGSPPPMRGKV